MLVARSKAAVFTAVLAVALALAACAPAAAPTPVPTKAPAAVPTAAPAAAPTKAAEVAKPPAPTPTAAAPTATPRPATVKVGTISAIADAGVFIAMEKGYFKEQGITTELTEFRSVAEMVPPLSTGQVHNVVTPVSPGLLAAADRGVELKIVGTRAQSLPKWETAWILLRKDLFDSGQVKTPADLKGMKIAIPSLGSLGDMTVRLMLEQAGLTSSDAEIVVLPVGEMASAFANKAIASAFGFEPFNARAVQEGFAVKWLPNSRFFGGKVEANSLVYGATLLKDPDLGRRWMIANLKGNRDYHKAFSTGEGRAEIVNILVKYSTVKDPKLYDVIEMSYIDPNGMPDKKSMDAQYKWLVQTGLYTGKKTLDDIMDLSILEYALQKLGRQ